MAPNGVRLHVLARIVAVGALTALPAAALLLAYAPGGFAEMSIVALRLGIDASFISTHQLARIVLAIFIAPLLFRLLSHGMLAAADDD
jgi:uncharacterized membrane protein AbrB (regulator of aidB expression)